MSSRARLLRALRRRDLAAFNQKVFHTLDPGTLYEHNWHLDHLCWQLMRVARGEVRRLVINVPPRSMKSITVSIGFTAWVLGHDPTKRIICVSYAGDLARKLSVDTRTVMESPWYKELFPAMRFAANIVSSPSAIGAVSDRSNRSRVRMRSRPTEYKDGIIRVPTDQASEVYFRLALLKVALDPAHLVRTWAKQRTGFRRACAKA
jgi:hypothetical protein